MMLTVPFLKRQGQLPDRSEVLFLQKNPGENRSTQLSIRGQPRGVLKVALSYVLGPQQGDTAGKCGDPNKKSSGGLRVLGALSALTEINSRPLSQVSDRLTL